MARVLSQMSSYVSANDISHDIPLGPIAVSTFTLPSKILLGLLDPVM